MHHNFSDLSRYNIINRIGEGPIGEVFMLKSKKTEKKYIAKNLHKSFGNIEDKMFLNEINSITKLKFPSITQFLGFSPNNSLSQTQTSALISEFISNKSLQQIIQLNKGRISEDNFDDTSKLITIYGIAKGMSFLHSHGIIHSNLKSENIIMGDNYNPLITDFALSKVIHEMMNEKSIDSTNTIHGYVYYLPPEFFTDFKYTYQADVFAFSMIMYEILTYEKPFNKYSYQNIVKMITQNYRPKLNSNISEAYQKLIKKCWDQDPNNRPTFNQIVQQLENDSEFLTKTVNKEKFFNYISKFSEIHSKSDTKQFKLKKTTIKDDDSIQLTKKIQMVDNVENQFKLKRRKTLPLNFYYNETKPNLQKAQSGNIEKLKSKRDNENSDKIEDNQNENDKIINEEDFDSNLQKLEELINLYKNDSNHELYYQTAREMYNSANTAYKQSNNEKYLNYKNKSLIYMKDVIENTSISTIENHCMFLINDKPINPPDYKKIGEYFKIVCLNGNSKWCLSRYLSLVDKGYIINKNRAELGQLYEKLAHCEKKDKNKEKSKEFIIKAVNQYKNGIFNNDPESMFRYALLIESNRVKPKKEKASDLYKKGAELNHPGSMYKYGLLLEKSKNQNDVIKALELFQKAADKNYPDAIFKYAQKLEEKSMIRPDKIKAIDLYIKAANLNHPDALFKYAQLLEDGSVIPRDNIKAVECYKKAADNGNVDAMFHYALIMQIGQIVPSNKSVAADYYKMASKNGHHEAMYNLGMMLKNGDGIPINKIESDNYLLMAEERK